MKNHKYLLLIAGLLVHASCSNNNGPLAIFKKLSPHDQYGQRLKDAGLDKTAMGSAWLQNADLSITKALSITIPYKETGYFAADKVMPAAFRFEAKRGEAVHVTLTKKPVQNFNIYADVLQVHNTGQPELIAYADTGGTAVSINVKSAGQYILRLQPELLRSGEYTLTITKGPSLAFPVAASGKPHIESFFGDSRDNGGRKHEGIDIFAPKGTPALAAAGGTVTRVTENKLGGLVVFLNPEGSDYELYYAHLGVQLVHNGQQVTAGDTVGLIDNTGNAKNTPSHLHFGIYTDGGAIDPLAFVNREVKSPAEITAPLNNLNTLVKTRQKSRICNEPGDKAIGTLLAVNTPLTVESVTQDLYKVILPNGDEGFIKANEVTALTELKKLNLASAMPLYDAPDSTIAARKSIINSGSKVNILAAYHKYYLVSYLDMQGWIPISGQQ